MKAFLGSFLCTALVASLFCGMLLSTQASLADEDPGVGVGLYCADLPPVIPFGPRICTEKLLPCPGWWLLGEYCRWDFRVNPTGVCHCW
jgi:hypothetical protein